MSFIDTYLKNHPIGQIAGSTRRDLAKLEKKLNSVTQESKNGVSFIDSIKGNSDQIIDLITRVQQYFNNWQFKWSTVLSTFQFVQSIATEVYQIVNTMQDSVVPDGIDKAQTLAIKHKFGVELTYFIWKTIDPLKNIFRWMPLKKMIEKRIVKWLAGMALNAAYRLFSANKEIGSFKVKDETSLIKAL